MPAEFWEWFYAQGEWPPKEAEEGKKPVSEPPVKPYRPLDEMPLSEVRKAVNRAHWPKNPLPDDWKSP